MGKHRVQPRSGVASKDFESLSVARCGNTTCIYVFDTGDNLHLRNRYQIYEISEDNFELKNLKALKKWSIHYPDGMSHDTEASAYNPKTHKILLFTKGAKSQVFELDLNDLQKEMKQIAELKFIRSLGQPTIRVTLHHESQILFIKLMKKSQLRSDY